MNRPDLKVNKLKCLIVEIWTNNFFHFTHCRTIPILETWRTVKCCATNWNVNRSIGIWRTFIHRSSFQRRMFKFTAGKVSLSPPNKNHRFNHVQKSIFVSFADLRRRVPIYASMIYNKTMNLHSIWAFTHVITPMSLDPNFSRWPIPVFCGMNYHALPYNKGTQFKFTFTIRGYWPSSLQLQQFREKQCSDGPLHWGRQVQREMGNYGTWSNTTN